MEKKFQVIVLATQNPGKVAEMRELLKDLPVRLISASEIEDAPDVIEDAPTLEGNAHKKAAALHVHTGLPALADDTGLEVRALNGAPGVHSARYAGPACDPAENREKLLRELTGAHDRSAQFRTILAFVHASNVGASSEEQWEARYFEGACQGEITREERGTQGFGYDAIFQPEGYSQTFAELPPEEKNAVSHRGEALEKFKLYLAETW